jgi:hypothetical protein
VEGGGVWFAEAWEKRKKNSDKKEKEKVARCALSQNDPMTHLLHAKCMRIR